jgi:hypothetical protein
MNPIIIIVIILLIGSSIFFYFFTKTTSQIPKEPPLTTEEPQLTTEEPPLTTEEPPLTTEEPKPEELSCLIINEDDYQFDNKLILGSELFNKKQDRGNDIMIGNVDELTSFSQTKDSYKIY